MKKSKKRRRWGKADTRGLEKGDQELRKERNWRPQPNPFAQAAGLAGRGVVEYAPLNEAEIS